MPGSRWLGPVAGQVVRSSRHYPPWDGSLPFASDGPGIPRCLSECSGLGRPGRSPPRRLRPRSLAPTGVRGPQAAALW